MRRLLLLLLTGCVAPSAAPPAVPPADPPADDTGAPPDTDTPPDTAPPDSGDTGDTGADTAVEVPCGGEPDPDRDMGFAALLGRLEAQRCLGEEDQAALVAFVETLYESEDAVWCDAVWRVSSADGLVFEGTPELVREHASVADVAITPGGTHVLVYNDVTPGLFAETLRDYPERFWRRGLVGVGGLGMEMDRGEGFTVVPLDLSLPSLALVVDPDLALLPDGSWRLVTFQVSVAELDGTSWDPFGTAAPHDYFRAASPRFGSFPAPTVAIASQSGMRGGADPTVLDGDGEEILFVGDFTGPLVGWTAPDGQYTSPDAPPDVLPGFWGAAPDVIADPAGGWRLYYKDPPSGEVRVATSADGRAWAVVGSVADALGDANNPSVARDADGTWWLYYGHKPEECVEAG